MGEDIYFKEEFIKFIDIYVVDIVYLDFVIVGGILEIKKIVDYVEEKGIVMVMYFVGIFIFFMVNVYCVVVIQNFMVLEYYFVDLDYWEDLVIGLDYLMIEKGFVIVLEKLGLGVDLNEEVVK